MNIRRSIARWLGYGAMEWPRSEILDKPVRFVRYDVLDVVEFVGVSCYPGGVEPLPGEIGCDATHRLIIDRYPGER